VAVILGSGLAAAVQQAAAAAGRGAVALMIGLAIPEV